MEVAFLQQLYLFVVLFTHIYYVHG